MFAIRSQPLPPLALLQRYAEQGAYADCYCASVPMTITHSDFVFAFYTSWVFKLERWILRLAVNRPSSDEDARQLALGVDVDFAAWSIEARAERQLLMCDLSGRTRSWLMTMSSEEGSNTVLYFGSAVVPRPDGNSGKRGLGMALRLLLGFHKLYSRVLLAAAISRLRRGIRA